MPRELCKTILLINICVIESVRDDQKPWFLKTLHQQIFRNSYLYS